VPTTYPLAKSGSLLITAPLSNRASRVCWIGKTGGLSRALVDRVSENHNASRGIIVTLRQLFYQFVARDVIANKQKQYKRLGSIVNAARMAGLIDWDYMQDRTRNLIALSHWDTPGGLLKAPGRLIITISGRPSLLCRSLD